MPYLMIENPVKEMPSVEFLRMLGASSSRGSNDKIGCFGSGFPYSLALLARHGLLAGTKICLGKDVYKFEIVEHIVRDSNGRASTQHEIRMRKQNGASWDLNISTDFGAIDWQDVTLAIREFVSNAIDGAWDCDGNAKRVEIRSDIPDEGRMTRAADGVIRVYIPINDDILSYVDNLHKYFRCLAPGFDSGRMVFLNTDGGPARIYRKGVLVGEFGEYSLFHYNINNIEINESRLVDSWTARNACAGAIAVSNNQMIISKYLQSKISPRNGLFENDLYVDGMNLSLYKMSDEQREKCMQTFKDAVRGTLGHRIVCENQIAARIIESKGFEPIKVDGDLALILKEYGARTADTILNADELSGKLISEATPQAIAMLDRLWSELVKEDMINGKSKPGVRCFSQHVEEGGMLGYYRPGDGNVYLRTDLSDGINEVSLHTLLHELAHYITGARDCTREFQEFGFRFAIRLMSRMVN